MSYDAYGRLQVGSQQSYGLQPKKKPVSASNTSLSSSRKKNLGGFFGNDALEDDDDEDDDHGQQNGTSARDRGRDEINRANKIFKSIGSNKDGMRNKDVLEMQAVALAQDADIFDYDGAYDSFKKQDHDKLQASKLLGSNEGKESPPKSRYIKNLQQSAKVRDINSQRAFDRKLLKERSAEDAEFGEKEAFITTAYQQKLDIEKRWEYEDQLNEAMEAKHDVVKNGMQGFYANLLTKNIATGADVDKNATSAYTAGGRRIDKALTGGDKSSVVKEDEDVAKDSGTGAYDNGKKLEKRDRQEHVPEEEGNEHKREKLHNSSSSSSVIQAKRDEDNPEEDASKSSSSVSLEVKKEVKIMSARDRYLARKKEQQLQVNDKE